MVAVLVIVIASAARSVFFEGLGRGNVYLTYHPAVMLAALSGGLIAGLLAMSLSGLLCFFWIQQGFMSPVEILALFVFLLSSIIISIITEAFRRNRERALLLEEEIRLDSQMLSNINEGILLYKTLDGKIIYNNLQMENTFGYLPGELIGKHVSILNSSSDTYPEEVAKEITEMVKKTGKWDGEIQNITKDGRDFWTKANISSFTHKEYGEVFVTVQQDITERKKVQGILQENEEKFRALVELANNVIVIVQDAIIMYVNPRVTDLFGFTVEELTGVNINKVVHPDEMDMVEAKYRRHMSEVDKFQNYDTAFLHKDGRKIYVNLSTSIISYQGRKAGLVLVQDISERKISQHKLEHKSTHDSLTGLYNRAFFDEELKRLMLGRRFPVSVIMADVDELKIMNDKYGHEKGDLLLQRAAKVLSKSFRGDDMVARLGGDEFVVLLPNTDAGVVKQKLLRIEKNINESNNAGTSEIPLSISLGADTAKNSSELSNSLLQADKNMYLEKNKDINRMIQNS